MDGRRNRLRHLPPSAVPVKTTDLWAGVGAGPATHTALRVALADYLGIPHEACYLAASGRTVIYALLKGMVSEQPERRRVIMPAYTCPVVPKVALDLGLEPVFVDIEPSSTRYVEKELARALDHRVLAVFVVHPFGIPLPISDILVAAHDAGITIIEDAAQALGARWNGQPAGLAGDYGLFSLGPGKVLSSGGGGIVVTGQEQHIPSLSRWWADLPPAKEFAAVHALARQAAFRLAFHPYGWWAATRIGLQKLGNESASWGYTVRDLSDAQAGVALSLLPRLEEINSARRQAATRLSDAVSRSSSLTTLPVAPPAEPVFLRLPVLAADMEQREALLAKLWSAGIGVGRMYERTLPSIFTPNREDAFPGASAFARRLLTLPTHYHVSADDLAYMESVLSAA